MMSITLARQGLYLGWREPAARDFAYVIFRHTTPSNHCCSIRLLTSSYLFTLLPHNSRPTAFSKPQPIQDFAPFHSKHSVSIHYQLAKWQPPPPTPPPPRFPQLTSSTSQKPKTTSPRNSTSTIPLTLSARTLGMSLPICPLSAFARSRLPSSSLLSHLK